MLFYIHLIFIKNFKMKNKIILGVIGAFIGFLSYAQDAEQKLVIEEGRNVTNLGFTDDGSFYMSTSKRVMSAKAKKTEFTKFNAETLEVDYIYKPKGNFSIKETSPKGEVIFFDDSGFFQSGSEDHYNVLHQNGEVTSYQKKEWVPDDFVIISDYISKDYYAALGYMKGRKNFKKKENKEYKLFRRDLKTFETFSTDFDLTTLETASEGEKFTYQILEHTNDTFTLISKHYSDKNDKGKNSRTQEYYLLTYNYNGAIVNEYMLKTKIPFDDMNYMNAYTGKDSYKVVHSTYTNSSGELKTRINYYPRPIASGNILVDRENKFFYTWGLIAGEKAKHGSGIMINKFDFNGKNLWNKSEKVFSDIKDKDIAGYKTSIELVDAGTNLGLSINNKKEDFAIIFQLDKNSGEILEKKEYGDFKYVYGMPGKNHFLSSLKFKDEFSKKYTLDMATVIGYTLNKKFKAFVDSFSESKKQLNFISSINKNGVVTIFADNKDKDFRLLKFNWN